MKKIYLFFAFLWMGFMGASAQEYHYDVNNDGDVNITDATLVVNKILGRTNPGEIEGLQKVDLGLPSGTLWANFNVGATKPEEFGDYYAWGETEVKDYYSIDTYKYYQNGSYVNIGTDISGTEYDVATALWGGKWCMPTLDDLKELIDNCTGEWTTLNGVNGYKFTGPNGNSIFLPAAGDRTEGTLRNAGSQGSYWLSTHDPEESYGAYWLQFYSNHINWWHDDRYEGYTVRPVYKNEPAKAVDLGLPSGTKWASCNIGASKPEEYGEYFAWGEYLEKKDYSKEKYSYYVDGEYKDLGINLGQYINMVDNNLNNIDLYEITAMKWDTALQRWGGNWCMPTMEHIGELFDNCTSEWTTLNGVNGYKFTGPNGNSIFLPAAGYRWEDSLYGIGKIGCYWSSTERIDDSSNAYDLYFTSSSILSYWWDSRYFGQSVRPIYLVNNMYYRPL